MPSLYHTEKKIARGWENFCKYSAIQQKGHSHFGAMANFKEICSAIPRACYPYQQKRGQTPPFIGNRTFTLHKRLCHSEKEGKPLRRYGILQAKCSAILPDPLPTQKRMPKHPFGTGNSPLTLHKRLFYSAKGHSHFGTMANFKEICSAILPDPLPTQKRMPKHPFGTDIHNETDCFRHYPYIFQTCLKPYVFK